MQNSRARQHKMIAGVIYAAICFTVVFGSAIAWADTASDGLDGERLINIDVKDGDIGAVLRMLAKAAGVNIVIGENVSGRVEAVTLRDVTVEQALRLITIAQGYHWHREGNVYVVTATVPPGFEESTNGITPAVPVSSGGISGASGSEATSVTAIHTPTPALVSGLNGNSSPVLVNPAPSTVVTATGPSGQAIFTTAIPLQFKDAGELAIAFGGTVNGSRLPGVAYSAIRPSEHRRALGRSDSYGGPDIFGGASASATSRWGQNDGDLGGGSSRGSSRSDSRSGRDNNNSGSSGRGGSSGGGLGDMLPGDMEPPTAFLDQNALIVRGTQAEIDEFTELVKMLDVKSRQVEISTKFISVQTTGAEAFGIDWSVSNGSLEFWNLGFAPSEAVNNAVRYSRGRFSATLAALQSSGRAMVINEPRVTCPNNQYAEVNFYTTIPYFTATTEYNQFGQRINTEVESDFIDVENSLYVMPRINADDSVTMYLEPELQDNVGEVEGPNGETIPIITTQYVSTTVTVPDGDTIVMGGLIRKSESFTFQETPLLAQLPVIGKLFRSKSANTSNSELLIFVTPRIIRDIPLQ